MEAKIRIAARRLEAYEFGLKGRTGNSNSRRCRRVSNSLCGDIYGCRLRASLLSEEDAKDQQDGPGFGRSALPAPGEGIEKMNDKSFASIWDAIEDTPAQAENMKLRSALMIALKDRIAREGLSQSQAAKLLGVTQPRVSDLLRGKIELFGLDTLVNMAVAAGLHVEVHVTEAA
jgi:predicted XRE-type DNA-binding protein